MGNKLKQSSLFQKTALSQIGTISICPNCQRQFAANTTYENFQQHVMQCLEHFRPTDHQRLRMQRRKKSKDSVGSSGGNGSEDEDFVTVEVYVKRKAINKQQSMQQQNSNPNMATTWQKTKLTYSQSMLSNLKPSQLCNQSTAYKLLWLHQKLSALHITWKQGSSSITFHPQTIIQDSIGLKYIDLWRELKLNVVGDVVHDAGGLLREWAGMLMEAMITKLGLFVRNKWGFYVVNTRFCNATKLNQQVKWPEMQNLPKLLQKTPVNTTKITYNDLFQMFGCLLAKIIIEKVTIPYRFDWLFLSKLLGKQITIDCFYTYDRQLYNSLNYLKKLSKNLQLDPSNPGPKNQLQSLYLTFTIPSTTPPIQLIPNGSSIIVSNATQLQNYLSLYLNHPSFVPISLIDRFSTVLYETNIGQIFMCDEFQVLVNGVDGDIVSVADWKAGTQYRQPLSQNHKVVKYFWNTIQKMSNQDRGRLLKFVTGSQRLPVYGFKQLQTNRGQTSCFVIQATKYDKKTNCYPKAHTCFNRLVLPLYPSQEILGQYLIRTIRGNFDGIWGMQ